DLKTSSVSGTQEAPANTVPDDVPVREPEPELPCDEAVIYEVWNADLFEDSGLTLISEDVFLMADYVPAVALDFACLQEAITWDPASQFVPVRHCLSDPPTSPVKIVLLLCW